ncbi:kinetochore protein SPC25 homolog isoform X2 [Aristolochia californica]|uniref:kinetochore protein SPC25 homolog isoform X2 n=1 Tax=Aristolochia californica TaxID=171875 RepID=UPI0035D7CC7E
MQKSSDLPRKMAEIRLITEKEMQIHRHKAASTINSLCESLQSIKMKAEETAQHQVKLLKLKDYHRQQVDDMVSVKTQKEAKHRSTIEALSDVKSRVEKLEKVLLEQQRRRDRCKKIISEQLLALAALDQKRSKVKEHNEDFQEPICWYNRVLGIHIEGGQGVKFIFNKIDLKSPNKKFSFTIRHDNDTYTLVDCEPSLDNIEDLIQDLNQTNELYKFVRTIREKFRLATSDAPHHFTYSDMPSTSITASASSVSVSGQNKSQTGQRADLDRPSKKVNHGIPYKPLTASPGSALPVRRSPRFKNIQ